jgi:polysaccharide export outer membrane protein
MPRHLLRLGWGEGGMRLALRATLICFAAVAVAGCDTLPSAGPTGDSIRSPGSPTAMEYVHINISGDSIGPLARPRIVSLPGTFTDRRPSPVLNLGIGDVVTVTIFEAAPGGLFTPAQTAGARPGNFVDLPTQSVDQNGNISVPYAGLVRAAGRTVSEVAADIEQRLRNRAIEPQVVVALREQRNALVSVTGDVNQPNRFPVNAAGERILDVIARAGGTRSQATETYVTLLRNGRRAKVWLNRLVMNPAENIYIRPGDTIYISRDPPTFMAFGAAGQNGMFTFDTDTFSLAQAAGRAGGLLDDRADPGSVFVYRMEERDFLARLGVDTSLYAPGPIATIYQVNFRDPTGYMLATQFQMRDRDSIFVANAKAVDYIKMINVIRSTTAVVREINAGVREVKEPF